MTGPSKPAGLFVGLLGLWVFLALALPLTYYFGGSVLPRYQCHQVCTVNDSAGLLTSLAFLALTLVVVLGLPRFARRWSGPRPVSAPQRRPVFRRRVLEPPQPSRLSNVFLRALLYAFLALSGGSVAFYLGGAHYDHSFCSAPNFQGECDIGVVEGFLWSATWIALVLLAAFSVELQLGMNWLLRRRGRLSS